MKRINKLFPLLLCACLSLAGCTGSGEKQLETAYQVSERDGKLFIETGFAILLTYDKGRDRITLSPGGEYERVTNPKNRKR